MQQKMRRTLYNIPLFGDELNFMLTDFRLPTDLIVFIIAHHKPHHLCTIFDMK